MLNSIFWERFVMKMMVSVDIHCFVGYCTVQYISILKVC